MDLFVLDENLNAVAIIDSYNSLIWTDRYNECGDFEIYTRMSEEALEYIKQDYYLQIKDSEHLMIIETIRVTSDADEGNNLTVTGRSLESILDRRVIWGQRTISGNLQNGVKALLDENIISPSKPERKIDNFIFKPSTDPAVTGLTLEAQYTGDNLYDVIQSICAERNIGFRITLNADKQFVFELYSGVDRSYDQIVNPYVVFSPNFDNLISSNYIESRSSLKNVTLVGGEGEGSARRYTAVGNTSGLARREIFTDARDISSDSSEDITELFVFTEFSSQVYSATSNTFVTDALFNSSTADISPYIGRTIRITIPQYTNASGAAPNYATVILDADSKYLSTVKVWDKYEGMANSGTLAQFEFVVPENAKFLYSSMYSQKAITDNIYYGTLDDFSCITTKLSNTEYINQLRQRGSETLTDNAEVISFEGEADTSTMFVYGQDFFNGDVVQVANEYGHETKARILEIVISENEEGHTVYPTFSTVTSNLPNGYKELEYIESSGTQFIRVDLKPTNKTRVITDIQLVDTTGTFAIFGTRKILSAGSEGAFDVFVIGGSTVRSDWFGSTASGTPTDLSQRTTIDQNRNVCTAWNLTLTNTNVEEDETAYPLYIFCSCDNGKPAYYAKMRLYSCKIYEDGVLVRDFIPAEDDTGVLGMYDLVYRTFYKNYGTGSFTTIQ